MKNWILLPLLALAFLANAQTPPLARHLPKINTPLDDGNTARLREINRDIWTPFMEAYATFDVEKYIALHTPDLIRSTGGSQPEVKGRDEYRASTQRGFDWPAENNRRIEIAFTFFERVASESTASERGIYRYTAILPDGERQNFYGKFHVFLRKTDGRWKIAVDYDSNEDGTIGEADFAAGLPPDVFSK